MDFSPGYILTLVFQLAGLGATVLLCLGFWKLWQFTETPTARAGVIASVLHMLTALIFATTMFLPYEHLPHEWVNAVFSIPFLWGTLNLVYTASLLTILILLSIVLHRGIHPKNPHPAHPTHTVPSDPS